MNIPEELKYTKEHEWVRVDKDVVMVGITDYAQGELGDVVFVELPNVGDHFNQDDAFGTIEAVKAVSDLFCPLSGEVVGINDEITDAPENVNKDPYGKGWMIKLKVDDQAQIEGLLDAESYKSQIGS